jgi:hypothetical protein
MWQSGRGHSGGPSLDERLGREMSHDLGSQDHHPGRME